jgi:hypothetical protein
MDEINIQVAKEVWSVGVACTQQVEKPAFPVTSQSYTAIREFLVLAEDYSLKPNGWPIKL